jgi:glutathione S-transferase
MKLVIGNKNYSSWSLRPWMVLKQAGIPFEEERLSFNDPDFRAKVARLSPSGRVPVLHEGGLVVWDSLAIVEYLAEKFPDRKLWPADPAARAVARSLCAEMHSGFQTLRSTLVMNFELQLSGGIWNLNVQSEIARIVGMWEDARGRFGTGGPLLFGAFSIADAFFAPVVQRFAAYGIKLPAVARAYADAVAALPSFQAWAAGARAENDYHAHDEPYRLPPGAGAR